MALGIRRSTAVLSACALIGCASQPAAVAKGPANAPPAAAAAARKTQIPYGDLTAATIRPADHTEAYGEAPQQYGELRLPTSGLIGPTVVLIHGGCWRAAYTLEHTRAAAAALADSGYAVWSPEYRRVGDPGGGWPGTFTDISNAIDFVAKLAATYPTMDASRVVLVGHSAGAQLALSAAALRPDGKLNGGRIIGVVSLAGITDLAAYTSPNGCGASVVQVMGGPPSDTARAYRVYDPIRNLPKGIPVRFVHGLADQVVPISQSRAYADVAHEAGVPVELGEVPGAGHFDVVAPQSTSWEAVMHAVRTLAPLVGR